MGKLNLKIYQTREKQFRLRFIEILKINELLQNHLTHFPLFFPHSVCREQKSFGPLWQRCPWPNTQNGNQMKHGQAKEFDFLGALYLSCSSCLGQQLQGNQFNISLPQTTDLDSHSNALWTWQVQGLTSERLPTEPSVYCRRGVSIPAFVQRLSLTVCPLEVLRKFLPKYM